MSVNKIQQFIWSKKENAIINNTMPNREWPNTQEAARHNNISFIPYNYVDPNKINL